MRLKAIVAAGLVLSISLVGCLEKKDKNPPLLNIAVDGEMGEDGWYVGSVSITMNATDNESGIKEIKYRINGDFWKDYVMPIRLNRDGFYFLEFYAKDGKGNEVHKNMSIKIDATSPSINFSNFEPGYIYFRGMKMITPRIPRDTMVIGNFVVEVSASDALSGIKKVEFYLGKGKAYEDDEAPFQWTIERAFGIYNVTAVAFDHAGNYAEVCIEEVQFINL
ncbi:MAG: hypothetical protein J7L31_00500 [Thermoplasmata archaeon]|nr:hypothetical protein [Thermoplasmata archaeon]